MDDHEEESARILAAHTALVDAGAIEPLSQDGEETRLWLDCELASLVEGRFFEPLDPLAMTSELRARWEPRATSGEPLSSPHGHLWFRAPYWIRDRGERAGTIALSTSPGGLGIVTVSSLYVLPSHRRRGVAARILRRAQAAVRATGGAGLRVPAYWTWQPAVRFYLGLGLWISNWKHSLVFVFRDDLPPHRVTESGRDGGDPQAPREATFGVLRDGAMEPLLHARAEGERLVWTDLPRLAEIAVETPALPFSARQTFAVALAVRGFPLVRSAEAWADRHSSSDCGDPEGLAHKIELFEGWDRQSGYEVRTPSIPGIAYRAWEAID